MQQQRRLARRRRALERRSTHADHDVPFGEVGQHLRKPLGAGRRIELVAGLRQTRRGLVVIVGPQRDHQRVGLVGGGVGRDRSCLGIDLGDRLTHEAHARLGDLRIRQPHRLGARAPEHHVELGEPEHERVALGRSASPRPRRRAPPTASSTAPAPRTRPPARALSCRDPTRPAPYQTQPARTAGNVTAGAAGAATN